MAETGPCIPALPIESDIPFMGYDESVAIPGVGVVSYYFSDCNLQVLNKPIIILDGFDPGDDRKGADIFNDELRYNGSELFGEDLRSDGYDVVILNFPQNPYISAYKREIYAGADYIERSAMVLVKLIKDLNQQLAANGSTEELIIMGPSMGGLISRYALAYMESNQMAHNTKLWFSFDSPHLGANIPIGDQYFLEFYARVAGNEGAENGVAKLETPAAKQMLVHHFSKLSYTPQAHYFRQNLLNNFASIGDYPSQLRKVAIANGSQNGTLNNIPCQKAFDMEVRNGRSRVARLFLGVFTFLNFTTSSMHFTPDMGNICKVFTASFPVFQGESRYASSPFYTSGYDTAPGGTFDTQQQLQDQSQPKTWFGKNLKFMHTQFYNLIPTHAFIPTTSALAYNKPNHNLAENLSNRNLVCTGEIPFDAYYAPATNEEHVDLTAANVDFAKKEINGTPPPLTGGYGLPILGPNNFCTSATYQIDNVPLGTTVTWSVAPTHLFTTTSGTGSVANLQFSNYYQGGQAVITFYLNGFCGFEAVQKTFTVGTPSAYEGGTYNDGIYIEPLGNTANFVYNQDIYVTLSGQSNYTWVEEASKGSVYWYHPANSTAGIVIRFDNPYPLNPPDYIGFTINSSSKHGCPPTSDPLYFYYYGEGGMYSFYPNPADENLTISSYSIEEDETLPASVKSSLAEATAEYEVKLYDKFSQLKRTATSKSAKVELNTESLPNGTYFLHITNGKETIKKQIVIQHP